MIELGTINCLYFDSLILISDALLILAVSKSQLVHQQSEVKYSSTNTCQVNQVSYNIRVEDKRSQVLF